MPPTIVDILRHIKFDTFASYDEKLKGKKEKGA